MIANPDFGFQVSAEGGGYAWSVNSRERQLTPWSNDPVTDRPARRSIVRDEDTGELWTPTAQPMRDEAATYVAAPRLRLQPLRARLARHRAESARVCAARRSGPKISRLTLRNTSGPRRGCR